LLGCVRESDILARLGGDEFVILLEEFGEDSNLTEIARKLLASVAELDSIDGREIGLSVSIGFARPGRRARCEDAVRQRRHRHVPRQGNGPQQLLLLFLDIHTYTLEKLALEAGLRHALERGDFASTTSPRSRSHRHHHRRRGAAALAASGARTHCAG